MAKATTGEKREDELKWYLTWRNPFRSDLCPVTALVVWMRLSGALEYGCGPIFGHLDPKTGKLLRPHHQITKFDHKTRVKVWVTEEGAQVNFTSAHVESLSLKAFRACGIDHATDHSWRVELGVWGGRMQRPLDEIIEVGDWNSFQSMEWFRYFKEGKGKYNKYKQAGEEDPVLRMFPWPQRGMNPRALDWNVWSDWVKVSS